MFDPVRFGVSIDSLNKKLEGVARPTTKGRVTQVIGLVVEGHVPNARMGTVCEIERRGESPLEAEIVGFRGDVALMMPMGDLHGVEQGCPISARQATARAGIGKAMLGRVLDGMGRPLDGGPPPAYDLQMPLVAEPINPMNRQVIDTPMWLGIRAIDTLITSGKGQRVGIFAGSGVGKSVTLGMIARNASSDVNVIALIGERGREVLNFIHHDLGLEGLKRSVVVCATSDTSPLERIRAAKFATTIAEYFREQGRDVLLMMDSITRFAMAQREIGLAVGEPPTTRGYPPSVFAQLPRLLERAGRVAAGGSITGLYTVLVEADDMNDPIGDTVRSIIDGHVVLSRDLASQNHYPAIDVPVSASRVMNAVTSRDHQAASGKIRELIAAYRKAEDLINIGAYQAGSNSTIDRAVTQIDAINAMLRQGIDEHIDHQMSLRHLLGIVNAYGGPQ
jgi:flagellum-specific ATP synthase